MPGVVLSCAIELHEVSWLDQASEHSEYRNMIARDRLAQRARRKALVDHRIFELEEQRNEFAATRCDKLRELILTLCRDTEALRIKIRVAYEELYRFQDAEGLFRAIAADAKLILGTVS